MGYKLANGKRMWEKNGNTSTLSISLNGLEILHQVRRGQMKTMVNTLRAFLSTRPELLTSC